MTISFLQLVDLFKANLAGMVVAAILCPLVIWITRRVGFLDVPGSSPHKQHKSPTPIAGGIVLVIGMLVSALIFRLSGKDIPPLMVAVIIIFLFGLWDDARELKVPVKFIGQILAAVFLIASDVSIRFLEVLYIQQNSGSLFVVLDWVVTILWLVGITNAFNLIDSMDGIAVGIASIAFMFFMIMALAAQQTTLAMLSACLLGICIGLCIYNVSPARLFLGDSGAQTLGFILAAVAMIYTPYYLPQASSWFVPVMVLGVPVFDTALVVVSRLRRHRSVFRADLTHTYHRLLSFGLHPRRAVSIIHVTTLLLSLLAFIALSLPPLQASLIFGAVVVAGVILLFFLVRMDPDAEQNSPV